ncbi:MAG TPA: HTTM domain-containing protein [Kofleriaceae bacterium]|nr:HTTM domain-containing protein [Kofleriaceae bacterium]
MSKRRRDSRQPPAPGADAASKSDASAAAGAGPGAGEASAATAPPPRRGNPIGRVWRAWVELWDGREAPTSLALCRILVAAVLLADLLQTRSYGLVETVWGPPPDGLGWGGQGASAAAAARWFGASVGTAWLLWWTAAIAALFVLAGIATRPAVLLLALTWAQLGHTAPDSDRGIDFMLRAVLLVLVFSRCNACWSVDAWFRRRIRRPFPSLVPSWPRLLIFAQLIWIYSSAGQNKVDKAWGPLEHFSALANILTDPHFARFDPAWIAIFFPVLQLATFATIFFELTSPVMILLTWWHSTRDRPGRLRRLSNLLRLRWVWILTGASFHLGIAVTMRLGIFSWGMLALYPVLFRPDELARAWTWLQAHIPRRGLRSASS